MTTFSNYIYNDFKERGTISFERRVLATLKRNKITGDAIAHNAYFERGNGSGSYYKCLEIEIDGENYTLRSHTNDSCAWDAFEPTAKNKRQLFEAVLNECIEDLKREIAENLEYYEN